MDWAHLFMPSASADSTGAASLDADQSLFVPPNDFFESLSAPSGPLPPRPPSVPLDLEPTPLFSPPLNPTAAPDAPENTLLPQQASSALGLQSNFAHSLASLHQQQQQQQSQQQQQQQQFSFQAPSSLPATSSGPAILPAPMGTLFDSSEETYLNSFLSSFDVEGLDIAPYVGSPLPMANMSSRTDFASMSLGMGIGAGVMGTMDDVIPHFSLDENPHSLSHGLSHMNIPSNLRNARPDPASSLAQNPGSFFDYGLGGSSHLSLGNVMSEEMRKVSSWLIQNQQQQSPSQSNMPGQLSLNSPGIGEEQGGFSQYPAPVSESDLSIKRKASHDQLNQPRKSRGNMRSPGREVMPSLNVNMLSDNTQAGHALSPRTPTTPAVQRRASEAKVGSSAKRRDSKKALQRTVLTEEERRANHIASEQRRRNQIRQGYAELISLVTTLQDPALGNHPGTAQSTPSKAVILAHTVQFIRGLEEGSRLLRKKLEDTNRELPPMHLSSQALAAFNPSK